MNATAPAFSNESRLDITTEISTTNNREITDRIIDIALNICNSRINAASYIGKDTTRILNSFEEGKKLVKDDDYEKRLQIITMAFNECDILLNDGLIKNFDIKESNNEFQEMSLIIVILFLLFGSRFLVIIKKKNL